MGLKTRDLAEGAIFSASRMQFTSSSTRGDWFPPVF